MSEARECCPCCGQELPFPVGTNESTLLAAMAKPGPNGRDKFSRGRDVYRIDRTNLWALTRGHWPNEPKVYAHQLVADLVARRMLLQTYPNCNDSFSLTERHR